MTEEERRRKHTEYARQWRKDNPEAVKAINTRFAQKHPERNRGDSRKWKKAHPDYYKTESAVRTKERYYGEGAKFSRNSREAWSQDDIDLVCDSPLSDLELAKQLGRTIHAIQIKRTLERQRRAGVIPLKTEKSLGAVKKSATTQQVEKVSDKPRGQITVIRFSAEPGPEYNGS